MLCAIHQPNFFPWMGYFNKIARADVFVFLNHVDYEKSGHSMQCYTNRVSIIDKSYIHCPVIREHGVQIISSVRINNTMDWRGGVKKSLENAYSRAPYYNKNIAYIHKLIDTEAEYIDEYNMQIIENLIEKFGINTCIRKQTEFETKYHSTELLLEIIKKVGCDAYMSGKGGAKYQNEELFQENNCKLLYQNYVMPMYKQWENEEFVGGLSILDAIFFCDIDGTAELIRKDCTEKSVKL